MHLIHTCIVSRHLATRGSNKILHTLVTPLPNSEQINNPSTNHTYTISTANHIHHDYAPSITPTHTIHIITSTVPTYAPRCHPWICGTAGQMDRKVGWWTTSRNIGLPSPH